MLSLLLDKLGPGYGLFSSMSYIMICEYLSWLAF
nr:hypothetical protein Q903MT_gene1492 [Picea sitchensis]